MRSQLFHPAVDLPFAAEEQVPFVDPEGPQPGVRVLHAGR